MHRYKCVAFTFSRGLSFPFLTGKVLLKVADWGKGFNVYALYCLAAIFRTTTSTLASETDTMLSVLCGGQFASEEGGTDNATPAMSSIQMPKSPP